MNIKSISEFILNILTTLGVNFIPLAMWLDNDFSGAETMVLYALENIFALSFALIVIRLLTPAYDDAVPEQFRKRATLIGGYALVGYGFALVTSIFIGFFIFGISRLRFSLPELLTALKFILIFQILGFVTDIIFRRRLSLIGADRFMRGILGRILVVQFFGVFLGIFCALISGKFVLPFIILKTLFDIGKTFEFFFGPKTDAEYLEYLKSAKLLKLKNF